MIKTLFILSLVPFTIVLAACSGQPTATPVPTRVPTMAATFTPAVPASPTARPTVPANTPAATSSPVATAQPATTKVPAIPAAQAALWAKWQTSPHANTYDLGKGPNTFCSRCHSPLNWDPASKADAPPNCVSCKFPTDATVRVAKSNPLVAQADWRNIGCEVCHRIDNKIAASQIVWFNKATGNYEPVAGATALCEKCHTDTDVLRHRMDLGSSKHSALQCTQCHDAHTTKASCTTSSCHASLSQVSGHDAAHAHVNCVACHDAGKLQVGPDNTTKTWTTWQTTEVVGRKTTAPFISHNLQKPVDCGRCHFAGNPWNLSASVKKTP